MERLICRQSVKQFVPGELYRKGMLPGGYAIGDLSYNAVRIDRHICGELRAVGVKLQLINVILVDHREITEVFAELHSGIDVEFQFICHHSGLCAGVADRQSRFVCKGGEV